ncbi:MAG: gliding motility lipoprotein GldD [Bacteroidota bacterium]
MLKMIIPDKLILPVIFIVLAGFMSHSCNNKNNNTSPKPKGYHRIDLPEKNYIRYDGECPYHFDYPEYAIVMKGEDPNPCWLNLHFPLQKATIYFTYKPVDNDLKTLTEDTREMVYKHTVKASAINETMYENDSANVYSVLYELKGNVASWVQFYMTDSTDHFVRGSLYFNAKPNKDSIAPVLKFIKKDITHLIETTSWN